MQLSGLSASVGSSTDHLRTATIPHHGQNPRSAAWRAGVDVRNWSINAHLPAEGPLGLHIPRVGRGAEPEPHVFQPDAGGVVLPLPGDSGTVHRVDDRHDTT